MVVRQLKTRLMLLLVTQNGTMLMNNLINSDEQINSVITYQSLKIVPCKHFEKEHF